VNPAETVLSRHAGCEVDAVVVGAGFAGVYMVHKLQQLDLKVRAFEAAGDVGGTWYWNRYPGARCDVHSLEYCYSFSEAIHQGWRWTERFASQAEILRYIQYVADLLDVRRDITFNTRVESAAYDESGRWIVRADRGDTVSCQFLIMAVGCLSLPALPDIPGANSFAGKVYHTGRWPHEPVDFAGQRVGVIGTGSSACQLIPPIAEQVAQLVVFQRTANHCVPARNYAFDDDYWSTIKENYSALLKKWRASAMGSGLPVTNRSTVEARAEERLKIYEHLWEIGGPVILLAFDDLLVNEAANETLAEFIRGKIREIVKDPKTAERLMPRAHPMGAKRICIVTDYYETFNRPNVQLVSTLETPIEQITATGVRTSAGFSELDSLIFATGFDALTGPLFAIDIRGRAGESLVEHWAGGPSGYLGLMTSGFPNLFTMTGPGSPSALSNVVSSIEQHVEWIGECLDYLRGRGIRTMEACARTESEWMRHVSAVAAATLFSKAKSWYNGDNIPGKLRSFPYFVGGSAVYLEHLRRVARDGYDGFILDGGAESGTPASDAAVYGSSQPKAGDHARTAAGRSAA
jgi:cyclohexanone monooxygenase